MSDRNNDAPNAPQLHFVTPKQTITTAALIKRLNRKLHPDDRVIRKNRGSYQAETPYYLQDWRLNLILDKKLNVPDLVEMARAEGCLADDETVAEEEVTA